MIISQVQISEALKGSTVGSFFFAQDHRRTAQTVSGTVNSFVRHDQNSHGTVYHLLNKLQAFHDRFFLIDQRCHDLCLIDISVAHLQKMAETFFKTFLHQFLGIVNLADAGNCEASQMGMYQKRLGIKV